MRSYLWAMAAVLVVLTSLGVAQVSAQWYYNGNYYTTCYPVSGNLIQCSGNLLQSPNGCVVLGFLVRSSIGLISTQYYTLQDLPSSYPSVGSWVIVTGQLNQGANFSPSGAACPGNYISVTSITETNPIPY